MEPALSTPFAPSLVPAWAELSENSRLGSATSNPALYPGHSGYNCTALLGLQAGLFQTRIGSRSTGKERDTESGNDYFGARYYASSMGRFMSPDYDADGFDPDPVPFADLENPQSLNLYGYVLNNPLNRTDPDGHWCLFGHFGTTCTPDPCAGIPNCVSVTAKPDPPPPPPAEPPTFWNTYVFNRNATLNIAVTATFEAGLLYSKAHGKGERNRTSKPADNAPKGAKPVKDKSGKIIGWEIPSADGKGTKKSLEWGKQNGLDPADQKWAKMGAAAAGAGAAATVWATLEEVAAGAALAF